MPTLLKIREALEKSWAQDTTYCMIGFSKANPALGQCLVSTLVLQHYLGGEIIRGKFTEPDGVGGSHYWLRIKGVDVDLTWEQFKKGTKIKPTGKPTRKGMLKYPNVRERYNALQQKVDKYLSKKS